MAPMIASCGHSGSPRSRDWAAVKEGACQEDGVVCHSNLEFWERRREEARGWSRGKGHLFLRTGGALDPQISGETRGWTESLHSSGTRLHSWQWEDVTHPSLSALLSCWPRSHPTCVKLLGQSPEHSRSLPALAPARRAAAGRGEGKTNHWGEQESQLT